MGLRFLAGICLMLAALAPVRAAPMATVRIIAQLASEPKFVIDPLTGLSSGFCVDVIEAIQKRNPKLRFAMQPGALPLARIQSEMDRGHLDANCLISNSDLWNTFHVAPIRLFSYRYYLIVRANDDVKVTQWGDVRALGAEGRVLVVKDTGVLLGLQQVGGLILDAGGATPEVNLKKLLAGRGRFFYYRAEGWKHALGRSGMQHKVKILPTVMSVEHFFLMFGKHVPLGVVREAGKALAELEQSGELERIRMRWEAN